MMKQNQPYKETLLQSRHKTYDSISKCLLARKDATKIFEKDLKLLGEIFEYVILDYPLLYYVENIQFQTYSESPITTIKPIYNVHRDNVTMYQQIEEIGSRITSRVSGVDQWNAMLYLHDTICKNVIYEDTGKDAHTIVGTLLNKRAVCDGISKTFKYFCDLIGIRCCVVTGKAKRSYDMFAFESHAWNKVFFNGTWYNVDVTYDLTIGNSEHIRHDYFMVSDQSMSSSHKEDSIKFSATATAQDYYTVNKLVMDTPKDLVDYIRVNYKKGVSFFEIKLPSTQNIDAVEEKILNAVSQALKFQRMMFRTEIYSNKDMLVFGIMIT